jgi:anti-sigma factor RsiW
LDDDAIKRRHDAAGESAPPERTSQSGDMSPTLFDPTGHLLVETLSDYLDEPGTFAAPEERLVETHVASCEACRSALVELRQIVHALAALPQPALPRSFALTPEQARRPAAVPALEPRWWQPAQWSTQLGKLRWATAVAALLFVVVLGGDLLNGGSTSPTSVDNQKVATVREAAGAAQVTATVATTGGVAPSSANVQSAPPQATTGGAAVMPTAAAAAAASPTAAAGSAAADTAASPAGSESYALQSAPEATATCVAAPEAAAPGLPPAVVAAPTDTENGWRVAEAGLALLTAWLLAAMLAIPILVRRDAGRDS